MSDAPTPESICLFCIPPLCERDMEFGKLCGKHVVRCAGCGRVMADERNARMREPLRVIRLSAIGKWRTEQ